MNKFHNYLSLTPAERAVLRQSWVLILASKLLLPIVQLPRLTSAIDSWIQPARDRAPLNPARLAELVTIAGRRTLGSTCLHRSLTLLVLLRRQATVARLAIGVKRGESDTKHDFAAHAWVETAASASLTGTETQYTRLLEYEI